VLAERFDCVPADAAGDPLGCLTGVGMTGAGSSTPIAVVLPGSVTPACSADEPYVEVSAPPEWDTVTPGATSVDVAELAAPPEPATDEAGAVCGAGLDVGESVGPGGASSPAF
jgi:hypothetical protein